MYPVLSLRSRLPELPSYPPIGIIYGKNHRFEDKDVSFVEEGKMLRSVMSKVSVQISC